MKTIFVIFVKERVDPESAERYKKYSFNTDVEVKIGDVIETSEYNSLLQVTRVLDECYKYFTIPSGELFNDVPTGLVGYPIKTLFTGSIDNA